jgi:DNA polymerase III epsilon subunit-like protein
MLAHNSPVDAATLEKEFRRLGVQQLPSSFFFINSIPIIQRQWPSTSPLPNDWSLSSLSQFFHFPPVQHRALDDCRNLFSICLQVFNQPDFKRLSYALLTLLFK